MHPHRLGRLAGRSAMIHHAHVKHAADSFVLMTSSSASMACWHAHVSLWPCCAASRACHGCDAFMPGRLHLCQLLCRPVVRLGWSKQLAAPRAACHLPSPASCLLHPSCAAGCAARPAGWAWAWKGMWCSTWSGCLASTSSTATSATTTSPGAGEAGEVASQCRQRHSRRLLACVHLYV